MVHLIGKIPNNNLQNTNKFQSRIFNDQTGGVHSLYGMHHIAVHKGTALLHRFDFRQILFPYVWNLNICSLKFIWNLEFK